MREVHRTAVRWQNGEMAESVDAPLDNRNANLRCGELGNSSRFKSGLLHDKPVKTILSSLGFILCL